MVDYTRKKSVHLRTTGYAVMDPCAGITLVMQVRFNATWEWYNCGEGRDHDRVKYER